MGREQFVHDEAWNGSARPPSRSPSSSPATPVSASWAIPGYPSTCSTRMHHRGASAPTRA